jgi:hypothetical protein
MGAMKLTLRIERRASGPFATWNENEVELGSLATDAVAALPELGSVEAECGYVDGRLVARAILRPPAGPAHEPGFAEAAEARTLVDRQRHDEALRVLAAAPVLTMDGLCLHASLNEDRETAERLLMDGLTHPRAKPAELARLASRARANGVDARTLVALLGEHLSDGSFCTLERDLMLELPIEERPDHWLRTELALLTDELAYEDDEDSTDDVREQHQEHARALVREATRRGLEAPDMGAVSAFIDAALGRARERGREKRELDARRRVEAVGRLEQGAGRSLPAAFRQAWLEDGARYDHRFEFFSLAEYFSDRDDGTSAVVRSWDFRLPPALVVFGSDNGEVAPPFFALDLSSPDARVVLIDHDGEIEELAPSLERWDRFAPFASRPSP